MSVKIDKTNLAIIKHLQNGKTSYRTIADNLNLTENTVRSRVNKLIESGVLAISGLVDPESIPHHRLMLIGVKLKTTNLLKIGEEFSKLRGVVSVSVVTGRFDLMLSVLFKNDYGLKEFYADEVSKIDDVRSLETFVVYKGYNLKVPYIL